MDEPNNDWLYSSGAFQAFFRNANRSLVLKANPPYFTILAVSDEYLRITHKTRDEVAGKNLFDVYPGSQSDASQKNSVYSSFIRVINTGETDVLPTFKYELPVAGTEKPETEYWSNINEPLSGDDGNVAYIINTTANITKLVREQEAAKEAIIHKEALEKELALNEKLLATNEGLRTDNVVLNETQNKLQLLNKELSDRVLRRTIALTDSEKQLQDMNEELAAINEELAASNEELTATNEELVDTQNNLLQVNLQLRASEARLEQILTQLPAPVVLLTGPNQVIATTNEALLLFWDKKKEEVLGKPMLSVFPELKNQPFPAQWKQVYETGEPVINREMPVRFKRPNGERLFYVDYHYQPLRDLNGAITGVLATVIDNTDKVLARQSIEESESRFRLMAEGTGVYIAVGDESSNATYFNKAWIELTGRSLEELLKFGWADLVHPEDREAYVNIYLTAFRQRQPFTGEFRLLNKEGDYCWLLAHGYPRFLPDGSFAGYISSCVDITERKKDEQRKNDFIGMVSHELKTPLTSMSAYIELSLLSIGDGNFARRKVFLEKAVMQVTRMTNLINGFLNVSRLESGQIHIDRKRFNMADLVKDAEEESASLYNAHRIVFAPVEETFVVADRDKIGQVISNLISNAAKYSPAATFINVACVTVDGMAVVSVKDKGIGIKPEDQKKLFERYYRVNNNTKSVSGFGIGLYLCAEIIQRHEGKIWVESEMEKGSTFYFSLPVA